MTPSTASRLSKFFGSSAGFWLSLQIRWDLYQTQQVEGKVIQSIEPHQLQVH